MLNLAKDIIFRAKKDSENAVVEQPIVRNKNGMRIHPKRLKEG
jgi:hypothetical protein